LAPNRSTTIPIIIRAGIGKAKLSNSKIATSDSLKSIDVMIISISGAWLNQTIKLIKNAIQVMCRIFIFPEKLKIFMGKADL
jgi:hypothetical protein